MYINEPRNFKIKVFLFGVWSLASYSNYVDDMLRPKDSVDEMINVVDQAFYSLSIIEIRRVVYDNVEKKKLLILLTE